ncbi:hypothetical protein ACFWDK_02070 [Micromonospora chalcea]|uniref:hypothetical protein n=1 Tax=Micromonospora sp. TSRI0369 TaxID=1703936 RepID=UPI0009F88AAD|nr:hypothetical protein [Micromonospora sp. TSRI0369]
MTEGAALVRSFASPPPQSRHWTFTAAATAVVTPALVWGIDRSYRSMDRCLRDRGLRISDPDLDMPEACAGSSVLLGTLALVAIAYLAATLITGLCVGVWEGRRRRGFGCRRWLVVAVVGLAAPWALVTYAAGYGIGRLFPPPAVSPVSTAWTDGIDAARRTLEFLSQGGQPGSVPAPGFFTDEPVYLDAQLHYARHYGSTVSYQQTSTVAFGSTAFVTGALLANAVGNASARSRAERLARPQWREHQLTRVMLTPTRTWCHSFGRWLSFDHAGVLEYHLDHHGVVLFFADTEPLRLTGPAAWVHAVFFAYFRFGASALNTVPFLMPLRAATSSAVSAAPSPQD